MKKGQLKALFIEAKGTGQKYIGVMIQTEGSSEPEVIINPKENFNAKFDYYMAAYDDDLILIAAKGKKVDDVKLFDWSDRNDYFYVEFDEPDSELLINFDGTLY
mgnify:FL=1